MADLRNNPQRMQELIVHIEAREGAFPYFYCDSHGLVTIGIGHLVDRRGATEADGQALARVLANQAGVVFRNRHNNVVASAQQIVDDWTRVHAHGQVHPGLRAADYAPVALLRISGLVARLLLHERVNGFIAQLYLNHPFAQDLEECIQMALIDTRFNPAGVSLYRNAPGNNFHPDVPRMWNALNRQHADYNLGRALSIFEQIWIGRATPRYQQRHRQRVAMFREGVLEMLMAAAAPGTLDDLLDELANRNP